MTSKNQFNIPFAKGHYIFEEDRIASFKSWPYSDRAKCNVKKMAEAGFFWRGNDKEVDTAACFACNKVLDGWERNDDPWIEHSKHAPQCIFIKFNKPESQLTVEEFLKLIQAVVANVLQRKLTDCRLQHQNKIEKLKEKLLN